MTSGPGSFWRLRASPVLAFRVVLAGLVASTLVGVVFATTQRTRFTLAFPGAARDGVYAGLMLVALLGLAAVVGLWRWQRWGVALYLVSAVGAIVLDVVAGAPAAHQVTVVFGAVLVVGLVYLNRSRFATGHQAARIGGGRS